MLKYIFSKKHNLCVNLQTTLSNSLAYFTYLSETLGKLLMNSFGSTLEQNYLYVVLEIYGCFQYADMLKSGLERTSEL